MRAHIPQPRGWGHDFWASVSTVTPDRLATASRVPNSATCAPTTSVREVQQRATKAGRLLDLYERRWQGKSLREDEFVISTDEKISIQARLRIHPSLRTEPGKSMRVEHEYARAGAWAYMAAMDVRRAKVFGRCEPTDAMSRCP